MTADSKSDDHDLHVQGNVEGSAVVVGDGNTVTYNTNVFSDLDIEQFPIRRSQQLSQQEYRWRQVLVQNVQHYWIEGVLERSLHNQVLIELGLEKHSQAVASPLSGVEEFAKEAAQPFPEGTQATDVFDKLGAGRSLLILGEPGAGKTTTLLKLAKTLLTRIGDDFSQPIPVILNLSSWAKKRQPIADWLVQALYETFQVSKALGTTWITEEELTLCLDGLDEVATEHRNACLQALNHFLQTHGRTEVVVCSRIHDYEMLSERLRVRCAIYVQPLTSQQIDRYLEQGGKHLSALKTVFSHNPEIRAFVASPLILSVMSLAYQGYALDEFPEMGSTQSFQQQLFDTYIERMFLRRGKNHECTTQQAKHWLVWMAQWMVQDSQTVFFIENIRPSWFQTWRQKLWCRIENSLTYGLICGLIGGSIIGLLNAGLYGDLRFGISSGLHAGGFYALVGGLIALTLGEITPVETLKWTWKEAKASLRAGLLLGLWSGLVLGLLLGLAMWIGDGELFIGLFFGLIGALISGLFFGLIGGLIGGLVGGLRGPKMDNKTAPNQGIWKSARNSRILGLSTGLSTGLFGGLFFGLNTGLSAGLICGLVFGLIGGGSACIKHFSLRLMLYRMGYTPWNYARFLDYAAERLFLQKVGGGYIFIHRMLLEHFAQMTLEQKRPQ